MGRRDGDRKILLGNQRAYFDYEPVEKLEAGMALRGYEVKSLKLGRGSIVGGRIILRGDEAFLVNALIQSYQPANPPANYEPGRAIKLLLTRTEISRLIGLAKNGLTIIPLAVYSQAGKLKLEFAASRGKKKYDKREKIKKRETERQIRRALKG